VFGEEELEEGLVPHARARDAAVGERRLSRELETGFRDDSDEEGGG